MTDAARSSFCVCDRERLPSRSKQGDAFICGWVETPLANMREKLIFSVFTCRQRIITTKTKPMMHGKGGEVSRVCG